jgi:hypothetical protein
MFFRRLESSLVDVGVYGRTVYEAIKRVTFGRRRTPLIRNCIRATKLARCKPKRARNRSKRHRRARSRSQIYRKGNKGRAKGRSGSNESSEFDD